MTFSLIPVVQLEIDIDRCGLTYGVGACTAKGAVGSECYNTFKTCQAKAAYTAGTPLTIKLRTIGSPIATGYRPYIKKYTPSPTEINLETGLGPRATATLTVVDEPCIDAEFDPYIANRATPAAGTYWTRFFARVHNYSGRPARIMRAWLNADGSGAYVTELYQVESMKGPTSNGEVTIILKDPLKLADRVKVPKPTSGKLAVALANSDLSLQLGAGEGTQYPAAGYVRVGDQIIRYTSNTGDVLSWPDGTYRSQFNTTAIPVDAGAVVQLCKVYIDEPVSGVIQDLCNESGIANGNIDIAGITAEDTNWLGAAYRITTCLSEPEDVSVYLGEISVETGGATWWSPVEQKVRYKFIGPQSPAAAFGQTLTEEANLISGSTKIDPQDGLRKTYTGIFYDLVTATANRKEAKNFNRGEIHIDTDAESANEYGDRRVDVLYSRWFGLANEQAMRAFIKRRLGRYRDAPLNISFKVDPKDADISEGDLYTVTTSQFTEADGTAKPVSVMIIKRIHGDSQIELVGRSTNFERRYGFIAPNGTSAYPNNAGYACICRSDGLMTDGSSGYLII